MVSVLEMQKVKGKKVRIELFNGSFIEQICTNFYQQEDDDENMLELDYMLINQSEIQRIEILN